MHVSNTRTCSAVGFSPASLEPHANGCRYVHHTLHISVIPTNMVALRCTVRYSNAPALQLWLHDSCKTVARRRLGVRDPPDAAAWSKAGSEGDALPGHTAAPAGLTDASEGRECAGGMRMQPDRKPVHGQTTLS